MNPVLVDKATLMVVLVDLQSEFVDKVDGDAAPMLARIQQLLLMSDTLHIPVLATLEEPIARKGQLIDCLAERLPKSGIVLPKLAYDLCEEHEIRTVILQSKCKQVAVVGAETDVCVMQSVLGLQRLGLEVFLIEDCVMSSSIDTSAALARMYGCGAIPVTWKSFYYELLKTDDADNRLRANPELVGKSFTAPEDLPQIHAVNEP